MFSVENLSITFSRYDNKWHKQPMSPVRDISLGINSGEIVAVVGSSGSGKSLLAHAVLGLLPSNAKTRGKMTFNGKRLTEKRAARLRGQQIALIPQSVVSLNPLSRVGKQVYRASRLGGQSHVAATQRRDMAFTRYNLEESVKALFPFQISGGMARRVLTATATVGEASLLIADEPTTGLDSTGAQRSLQHLRELADRGKAVMLITHDIDAAVDVADKVAVIYGGTTVEIAPAQAFRTLGGLKHPYSRALWDALPQNGFHFLDGNQPLNDQKVKGCIFADRCPRKTAQCSQTRPPLRSDGHTLVRCRHA